MRYHFKVHKEGSGFWAECIELKGCVSQASSRKKLEANLKEALNLFLSEPESSKIIFPPPKDFKKKPSNVIAIPVDPKVALAVNIRNLRLRHGYTQKQIQEKLSLNNLYSYQRLEEVDSNPTLATLVMLKKVYGEEFGIDQIFETED
jgi:antitoxin HicB